MAHAPALKKARTETCTTLYSYWRSSCSWRVRIALELKDIEYSYKAIHLLENGGEQFSNEYTEMNPNQRLPTLVIDGHTLSQSAAILEYLEETRNTNCCLLPTDAFKRAKVREICGVIGSDIQPVQNLAILRKIMGLVEGEKKSETKMKWGHDIIDRGFKAVEAILKQTSGKYCLGDALTLADVFLVPQVYNAVRFEVDMTQFPNIQRINTELESIPAFQKAHPSKMQDAV